MHDDHAAWASVSQPVCLSRGRLFLLIRQMAPLRCSHYYITVASNPNIMEVWSAEILSNGVEAKYTATWTEALDLQQNRL